MSIRTRNTCLNFLEFSSKGANYGKEFQPSMTLYTLNGSVIYEYEGKKFLQV